MCPQGREEQEQEQEEGGSSNTRLPRPARRNPTSHQRPHLQGTPTQRPHLLPPAVNPKP